MNDLLDRVLGLPRQQKLLILGVIIVALVVLDYLLLYSSQQDQIKKLKGDIETAQQERDKKKKLVAEMPKLQQQIQYWEGMLKEAAAQLPDRKEIPDLLSSISNKAREAGLEIMTFRPKAENLQDFYAEIPVDIVVKGGFHNVVTFFDEVGRLSRLVNIQNIEIKAPQVKDDQVTVETTTQATTFRFLDEGERKKIAEEKAKAAKAAKETKEK